MNNAFLKLHDYAVGCGLLDRMPEVGRQLRETTQKFLSLARKSTDEASEDDEHSLSRESDSQPTKRRRPRRKSSSLEAVQRTATEAPPSHRQLYGGLVVTQEKVSLADLASSHIPSGLTGIAEPDPTPDYEVITYPTLDNASFPFGLSSGFSFTSELTSSTTQPEFSSSTTQPDFSDINLSSTLYPSLPLPNSYASQEVTFGRRFQRTALERAWTLVTMPNPPRKRFSRVFGFCLLFEPLESIKTRLRRGLDRTAAESLNNWQYPFLQLGGSTTHFDTTTATTTTAGSTTHNRFGNQGTADVMRSKNANGFSTGPFDAKTTAARDMLVDANQYLPPGVGAPGFGAEFYDSDEIEMYLHQRGVAIPPAADFVTVEIEATAFTDGGERVAVVVDSHSHQATPPSANGGLRGAGGADAGSVNPLDHTFPPRHASSSGSGGSGSSDSRSSGRLSPPGASSGGETALTALSGDFPLTDMWRFGGVDGFLRGTGPGKKQVTVDVNLLIFGMYLPCSGEG